MTASDLSAPEEQAGTRSDPVARAAQVPARRRLLLGLAVAGLVLLLALALVVVQLVRYDNRAEDRADALAAARQSALNLTSLDTENFAEDVQAVLDGATGPFKADFEARSKDLEGVLKDNQVRAEGKVLESALVRADRRNATALVVVDSTVRNTAAPEGRVNTYRMRLELEQHNGRWLTSMLEFVG